MATTEMIELVDVKLITCIVQREKADSVIEAAVQAGAQGATVYYGVGMGVREKLGAFGVAINVEKEISSSLLQAPRRALLLTSCIKRPDLICQVMELFLCPASTRLRPFCRRMLCLRLRRYKNDWNEFCCKNLHGDPSGASSSPAESFQ